MHYLTCKGNAGSFLQTGAADVLKRLVMNNQGSLDEDGKQNIIAFLSGGSSYAPQSGHEGVLHYSVSLCFTQCLQLVQTGCETLTALEYTASLRIMCRMSFRNLLDVLGITRVG